MALDIIAQQIQKPCHQRNHIELARDANDRKARIGDFRDKSIFVTCASPEEATIIYVECRCIREGCER